ncbi:homeodomain-interacting protein kinase 1-like [Entelurus aequoreus]|uniref:homeodomain-interacting protein kinase 1-like n=1 Tax=Entelurus aequoreus TaxID=161455 RepID=UPI002B1D718C|nr:homeodomain-interacting protein kinase 1-like [Entelurus aequoreus]
MSALSLERKEFECLHQLYNHVLSSKCCSYKLLSILGEGRFGIVAECLNLNTSDCVAVKLLKRCNIYNYNQEVQALQKIRFLDKHRNSLVRFIEHFIFQDFPCLVFEMLDKSLEDLMTERNMTPLNLHQIRPVTSQLLMAFEALQALGIIHTDLKPDNVMLVDHKHVPFRVKLIDFGLAHPITSVHAGMTLQAEAYRAPEVTLGLPLSEAIDMWSLGCTIAYLFFGFDLFDCSSLRNSMGTICQLFGQPGDHLLNMAKYTSDYFMLDADHRWTVISAGIEPAMSRFNLETGSTFEDLALGFLQTTSTVEYDDWMKCVCLLKCLLSVEATSRATPRQALNHSFLTMAHLMDNCPYKEATLNCMMIAPIDDYVTVKGRDEGYGEEEPDCVEELYGEEEPGEVVNLDIGSDAGWLMDADDVVVLGGDEDIGVVEEPPGVLVLDVEVDLCKVVDLCGMENSCGFVNLADLF